MKNENITVSAQYLKDLLGVLKEALDCLGEYAGNDSESLDHLLEKYDQWVEKLKPHTY